MEAEISLKQKIVHLFKNNPKPIFDHFRNIGIVAALTFGAGELRSFNLESYPWYVNDIALACSYITFAIAIVLLIINISFAQLSINLFFFNKTKFNGFFQKLSSAIVLYSYTGVLFALTVMYAFNFTSHKTENLNPTQAASEELYLNIDKVNETIGKLREENKKLKNENSRLKSENKNPNLESTKYEP